jgi:cytochrome b
VRPWAFALLAIGAGFWLSHQIGVVSDKLEDHKAAHTREAEKTDAVLNEIHSQLLMSVAQIPALQIQAADAQRQADRANARLDGAERDPSYAGKR